MGKLLCLIAAALTGGMCSCQSSENPPAVTGFELEKYLGTWYEIARLPQWFERGMTGVTATYSLNPDGTVRVVNRGIRDGREQSAEGIAKFASREHGTAELEVSFFRPFYAPYRVIALAPDYSWAMVCSSGRNALWILARQEKLSGEIQKMLLDQARGFGFAVERMEFDRTR